MEKYTVFMEKSRIVVFQLCKNKEKFQETLNIERINYLERKKIIRLELNFSLAMLKCEAFEKHLQSTDQKVSR